MEARRGGKAVLVDTRYQVDRVVGGTPKNGDA